MSFIQCSSEKELELVMKDKKHGFVTEDFRIYDQIHYSDDAIYYELDAEVIGELYNLQLNIEMLSNGRNEMSFHDVSENAKMLQNSYEKLLELIKFKSLKRSQK